MVDKLGKYTKIILYALIAISIFFIIFAIVKGESSVNTDMVFAYIMIGLTILMMLFSPIFGIVINPKGIKGLIIFVIGAGLISLFAYLLSKGPTLPAEYLEQINITTSVEAFVDWAIIFFYIIFGGTILSVIYSVISKFFN